VTETLLLTRSDVAAVLDLDTCMDAVEDGLRRHAAGASLPPRVLGLHGSEDGTFHVKAAGLKLERGVVAVKVNANFPSNPGLRGLPTIQGVVALFDGGDGRVLALLDSMEVTAIRTAAATGVAARLLARREASVAGICGCGRQGRVQLRALARVRPVRRALAWDKDRRQAERFAGEMTAELQIAVSAVASAAEAAREADMVVTCTTSREAFLDAAHVGPGAFVAAVGADNEHKQELSPDLMARSRVVADDLEQCAAIGDLHHAIAAGAMSRGDVHAELAAVVAGQRPGRTREDEVFVFDSTGVALWDVAAAAAAYEGARRAGRGVAIDLGR
jgi:alanine dehydrogenase